MLGYEKRYKALNAAQKQAVDSIEGPVMVVAGPGTGKTELVSLRAANILRLTDMNPSNILCLTFTESGVRAMRERLIDLFGQDAYKVSIQTFHAFGSEIMSENPDFFYSGGELKPADELSVYEILYSIFEKLPRSTHISKKLDDQYTYMSRVQESVADFKRAGLTPDEIRTIAKNSLDFIEYASPIVKDFWPPKITKELISKLPNLLNKIDKYEGTPSDLPNIPNLEQIFLDQLKIAIELSSETGKTNSITSFKDSWLEKNTDGDFVFKNKKRLEILKEASAVYDAYLNKMLQARMYDYDDMILRVAHGLEIYHDLRLNLQERYQYIMVDEFQDTNGAQMRILHSLINIPSGDSPNIMVVGDDDQAIYSFQGAEVSNILDFEKTLKNPSIVTLKENYRSTDKILGAARAVITQGDYRLENNNAKINKKLISKRQEKQHLEVEFLRYDNQASEYSDVAKSIANTIKNGVQPANIAVLARNKKDILDFIPYLHSHNIKVSYEHDEDILKNDSVELLIILAKAVNCLTRGDLATVNSMLPKILSHPAFDIKAQKLWQLSLKSYEKKTGWLQTMQDESGILKEIANWLIDLSHSTPNTPVEQILDKISGTISSGEFVSPLKKYFFSKSDLTKEPGLYITHLEALSAIRSNIREYRPNKKLFLEDFVNYVDLVQKADIKLKNHYNADQENDSIKVMTAHKSKGLEFEKVYIINATDSTWGRKSRGYARHLSYPENMGLAYAGETYDDRLRLFYVAMTRAERQMIISAAKTNLNGRPELVAEFISSVNWQEKRVNPTSPDKLTAAINTWQTVEALDDTRSLQQVLSRYLDRYKLSATHLNTFIDVTQGGPQAFLTKNLLHFPQAIEPNAAMGSSVHLALQKAHQHLRKYGDKRPIEDVVGDFEIFLSKARLNDTDFAHRLETGSDALRQYLENCYSQFTPDQFSEYDFSHQNIMLGEARLTGLVDVISIDETNKTISITDYKTGKPALGWKGKTDFEKIKLHKYKQQLMFYHLLVQNSREFKGYSIETLQLDFIEPTTNNTSVQLKASFTEEELDEFEKLIKSVWKHIKNAQFVDTSRYDANYKGILDFEKYLKKLQ